jgi:hypothetical protein
MADDASGQPVSAEAFAKLQEDLVAMTGLLRQGLTDMSNLSKRLDRMEESEEEDDSEDDVVRRDGEDTQPRETFIYLTTVLLKIFRRRWEITWSILSQ